MDKTRSLLRTGVIGTTVVAALCCFTPALVILLGAVGLSVLTEYLDFVLYPALLFFIVLTGYAFYPKRGDQKASNTADNSGDRR